MLYGRQDARRYDRNLDGETRLKFLITMSVQHSVEQEKFIRTNTGELREKIAVGMEQIRHGEMVDGKTAIQNLREKLHGNNRRLRSI